MKNFITLPLIASAALSLTACATSINSRSPEDVAARAFPVLDSYTGLKQLRLPSITQSSWSSAIDARAYLQTAEDYQGRQGGAWMDVAISYETPTPNPDDMLVFNKSRWAGGEEVLIADFSAVVQNCEERAQSYTSGPNYGGYYGGGYYGSGYGSGYGRGGYGRGHDGRDDDHDGRGHRGRGNNDGVIGRVIEDIVTDGGSTPRPERPGRRSTGPVIAPSVSTPPPARPAVVAAPAPVSRPAPVSSPSPRPSPSERPSAKSPVARKIEDRLKGMNLRDVEEALAAHEADLAAKPKAEAVRLASNDAEKSTTTAGHRPYGGVNVGLGLGPRPYNYGLFPRSGYGYSPYQTTETVVSYSCKRREQLRVFVPADRLAQAADYDGLVLLLRGKAGSEQAVRLSPSYVRGYSIASFNARAQNAPFVSAPQNLSGQQTQQSGTSAQPRIYGER